MAHARLSHHQVIMARISILAGARFTSVHRMPREVYPGDHCLQITCTRIAKSYRTHRQTIIEDCRHRTIVSGAPKIEEPILRDARPMSAPGKLHPLPLRFMHWINAVAIFIMIGSGWKIYNDEVIFGWLHFPEYLTIGKWAQHGLQWHFLGMWIFVTNGITYVSYGLVTGRFRRMLVPVRWKEISQTVKEALKLHLAHDDLTKYNAVQKLLYIGVICVGIMIVVSGLAIWKPVQFSELLALFGNFQNARLVHFLCMSAIVLFIVVHVTLALLVPRTLVSMMTGGPVIRAESRPEPAE
ncbi:MAG: cytochrome b/b6 domain-containing protein [Pseudolabrys sp.]